MTSNRSFFQGLRTNLSFIRAPRNYQQISQQDSEGTNIELEKEYDGEAYPAEEAHSLLESYAPRSPSKSRMPRPALKARLSKLNLFWKTIAIILTVTGLFYAARFIIGLFNPVPNGLEQMPVYGDSLECRDAPFVYNSSTFSVFSPMGSLNNNHFVDIKGVGVGTVSLAAGEEGATSVEYEVTIRSNSQDMIDKVMISQPHILDDAGGIVESRLIFNTAPYKEHEDSCLRFDMVVYIPPSMQKLHVASHAAQTHLRFDPDADVKIDSLFVTLYSMSSQNLILPNERLRAKKASLEVFNGYIVGDVLLLDETKIKTQRGRGVTNVKVHPSGSPTESPSQLSTVTGRGRTDITYVGSGDRRPMRSVHISTDPNSKMYLTYSSAEFNGRVELAVKNVEIEHLAELDAEAAVLGKTEATVKHHEWTHYAGSAHGPDELYVDSRGWAGVYL